MESKNLFPIAIITKAFGFKGEVGLQPLIMQYDDYLFNKQVKWIGPIKYKPKKRLEI